jgi:NADH:ubiquinone oxidoreductase subunit K
MHVTLWHFLMLSAVMAAAGVATMLLRRNPLGILAGIELIVMAAMLNLVAFQAYAPPNPAFPGRTAPQALVLMIMAASAVEAGLLVAVLVNFYRAFGRVDVERARN